MKEASNRRRRGYELRRDPESAPIPRRTRQWGLGISIGVVLLATAIVVGSLYNIQIRNGEMYSRYASDQQLLDTSIQATRGEIYDASVVWDIWCDPSYSTALYDSQTITSTNADGEEVESTVRTLDAAACGEISRELTLRLLSGDGVSLDQVDTASAAYAEQYEAVYSALSEIDSSYQVLAEKVNNAVKESIEKYVSDRNAIKGSGRLSLSSSRTYQRNYPYGAFAASVLGFTNADGEGFYGLEKSYDDILSGTDGRTVTIRNARGNAIADGGAVTYDAKDGDSLVLTLDTTIQEVVEKYLNEAIAANIVENRGCAIVMDVNTGGILAMASKPDFDPNNPNDYTPIQAYLEELVRAEPELYGIYLKNEDGTFVTDEEGNKILDPEADYSGYFRDIMWKNKTITELYYPGSVFKVITAAMGVDSGNATYNTTFTCNGAYAVAKETYHCAGRHSHGTQNLADALLNSCNIYFIQLGQRVGVSTFYEYFKAFGFTERTGVDLPNETSYMQYYTDKNMGEVELASSAFGQSMAVTPLQVCTAVAAAVNGGYLVTPHVVDQIVDANGNVVEQIGPNVRRQVISGSASETIRQIMEHEVGDGTHQSGGYRAYVAGYRIGGKSGTSELLNMDRRRLFLHPGGAGGGQHHQRDRALPRHRHRRHRPQRADRPGAQPGRHRVEQRPGQPEHPGAGPSPGRERGRQHRRPGHLAISHRRRRGAQRDHRLSLHRQRRRADRRGARPDRQERRLCPADAAGGRVQLHRRGQRRRPGPGPERGSGLPRPAGHHRDGDLRVAQT